MEDARADEAVGPDGAVVLLRHQAASEVLHVHVSEEVSRYGCVRLRVHDRTYRNLNPLVTEAVETVEPFDADDRRECYVHAEVQVVAVAESIAHFRVRCRES